MLSLPALYAISFLTGSLSVLFMVADSALFVALVPKYGYVGAQSLLNGSRALSSVVGPSLGGLLVQALTAPLAIAVDAVSYAVRRPTCSASGSSTRRARRSAAACC